MVPVSHAIVNQIYIIYYTMLQNIHRNNTCIYAALNKHLP